MKKHKITLSDIQAKRDIILSLGQQHGARDIRVFGSIARNEQTTDSDIDLLVSWDYESISEWGGVGFDLALEELFGCKVDVISERTLSPHLRERILKDAKHV